MIKIYFKSVNISGEIKLPENKALRFLKNLRKANDSNLKVKIVKL